jgi:hypothetical protein
MTKSYANAAAFRQALEARLKAVAEQRSVQIQGVRLKVAIERLLARLFHAANPPWLLKGGYSMELRFRPRARTTRDVDLTVGASVAPEQLKGKLEEIHEALQAAAEQPLNDFFEFLIEPARREIEAAPGGGGVFGVVAAMGGRDFARFHLDVGFGDCVIGEVETLEGDNLLDFAGIPPARAVAIPKAQQFAEKLHAYSYVWTDRENKRSKDLVDLVVLIERGELDPAAVRQAVMETFQRRKRHSLPATLQKPPASWSKEFPSMATEAGASMADVESAFKVLDEFWRRNGLGASESPVQ